MWKAQEKAKEGRYLEGGKGQKMLFQLEVVNSTRCANSVAKLIQVYNDLNQNNQA